MTTYTFDTQLAQGQAYERRLDEFFQRFGLTIRPATADEQRRGIDRWFIDATTMESYEYKADSIAGATGNAFIETVSVDVMQKPGWAWSSQATYLVYLVTEPETIYLISMRRLRRHLPIWQLRYRTVQAANDGYNTIGVLVPLRELEAIAIQVW
jgi:hypothetical protein